MTEGFVAVTFAFLIVVGMATGQIWSRVVSEGMPFVRRWVERRLDDEAQLPAVDRDEERARLVRRIHHLEEQVEFFEALVDRGGDDSNRSP